MNRRSLVGAAIIALTFSILGGTEAAAAELKVFCANAMESTIKDLGPKFERASGHTLAITFGTVGQLVKRLQADETADVVFMPRQGIESLIRDDKVAAANVAIVARSSMGVAIRKGAPKPDISSAEAFKRVLLAARSITYSDPARGGTSGPHFARVLERLGIADQMKAKTVFLPEGGLIGILVANGKAELAMHEFQQLLQVPGIEIVGPLPADLQNAVVFAAAPMNGSNQPETSGLLVDFLSTTEAAAVIKAKGFEAVSH